MFMQLTSEQLTAHIILLVKTKRISHMDAVLHFCEQRGIEPDAVAPLLGAKIRAEIAQDAQRLHLIPKTTSLV